MPGLPLRNCVAAISLPCVSPLTFFKSIVPENPGAIIFRKDHMSRSFGSEAEEHRRCAELVEVGEKIQIANFNF